MNDYDYFQNKKKKTDKEEIKIAPLTEILLDLSKVRTAILSFIEKLHIFG